jgi:hypothetical protein
MAVRLAALAQVAVAHLEASAPLRGQEALRAAACLMDWWVAVAFLRLFDAFLRFFYAFLRFFGLFDDF